jgi:hypothetical protein
MRKRFQGCASVVRVKEYIRIENAMRDAMYTEMALIN